MRGIEPDVDLLSGVEVLCPAGGDLRAFLRDAPEPPEPFGETRLRTLGELSRQLLEVPELRREPAAVAVGYWLRPSNLVRIREAFERRRAADPEVLWVPAGRVFHLAPGNVDTLFLYSWALAYLCGNRNVVRLSRERTSLVAALLDQIGARARLDAELHQANLFVAYGHDVGPTALFSRWCSQRMIWGGDEAVQAVRAVPLNPHASERAFAGKQSLAMIATAAYEDATPAVRERLAQGFFVDLFWFDQRACSSPQAVVWVGPPGEAEACQCEFDRQLQAEADRRAFAGELAHAANRLRFAFDWAVGAEIRPDFSHPSFLSVRVPDLGQWQKQACGGGVVVHLQVARFEELLDRLDPSDQTITHFGFSAAELLALARASGRRGIDRLVPIGEALAFSEVWDGISLVDDFLRRVVVRGQASKGRP